MGNDELVQVCKSCGAAGNGNYCNQCGHPYSPKRISLSGLLHDIFHFFTHLDKGFGYTLKRLVTTPGHMQREYLEGDRARYQKPFSMFLICATVTAIGRYWIFQVLMKYYGTGNTTEATFFHEYMIISFSLLLPFHVLLIFALFYKSGYNYAEIGVLTLYSFAFLFLGAVCITLLRFIWPEMDTAYIDLPFFLMYNTITFMNFFHRQPRWLVAIKSVVVISAIFFSIQFTEDFVIKKLLH